MHTPKRNIPPMLFAGPGLILLLALALSGCHQPSLQAVPAHTGEPAGTAYSSTHPAATPTPTLTPWTAVKTTANPFGGGSPGALTFTPTARLSRVTWSTNAARPAGEDAPTRTPKPTRTPSSTRWVATDIPLVWETPTWLPTPPSGAAAYRLKAWGEAAALELVAIAEQFSFADNIPRPFGEKRFDYQADQEPIILAACEARHRFPEASFGEKLAWRIALAETIQDQDTSDAWILQQMEAALNRGQVTPESLNQLLIPFGFQVGQQKPAPNLFGDGRPAQALWITRLDRGYTGLYAGLRQEASGRYALAKIHSTWDFNFGYDGDYVGEGFDYIRIEDHTGDGVPEVLITAGWLNGSMSGYELVIAQWQSDHFVDLSRGRFDFDTDGPNLGSWKYGTPDGTGAEPVETWRAISYPLVYQYERYEWNGEGYELHESRLEPPGEFGGKAAQWVVHAMSAGKQAAYAAVIEIVQGYLADEASRAGMRALFGPSYPDYLRFQLGLAYAFQSDADQAQAALAEIVQAPDNPLTATISQAAQAYLDNYTGEADLYRACQAALIVMEKASGARPYSMASVDYARLRQVWGYKPGGEWGADSIALCSLDAAFQQVAARLDGEKFSAVPTQLTRAGVSLRASVAVDLDEDGQTEWVLLVNTPGDDVPLALWVVLKTAQDDGGAQSMMALPVVPWEMKSYNLPVENAYAAGLAVKTVRAPEGTTVTFIRTGEFLYAIQLETAKPAIDWLLWPQNHTVAYRVYPRADGLELAVTTNTYYCQYCTNTYRWDGQGFESYDAQEEQFAAAEAALLVDWDPDEAIPLLKKVTANADQPRQLYLLGLAYELAGQADQAVQTYWSLWRDHPESPYALLAQAKLESRDP